MGFFWSFSTCLSLSLSPPLSLSLSIYLSIYIAIYPSILFACSIDLSSFRLAPIEHVEPTEEIVTEPQHNGMILVKLYGGMTHSDRLKIFDCIHTCTHAPYMYSHMYFLPKCLALAVCLQTARLVNTMKSVPLNVTWRVPPWPHHKFAPWSVCKSVSVTKASFARARMDRAFAWQTALVSLEEWAPCALPVCHGIYPKFNGSHFGLPPSSSDRMTGLGGNMVWMMMYVHKPYCFSFVYTYSWRFNWADSVGYCQVWRFLTWLWGRLTLTVWDIFQWKIQQQRHRGHWRLDHLAGLSMHGLMSTSATIEDWIES